MAQQIATTLRNDNHGDADFSYEALKAYQMLYLPKQYDGKFLRARVMLNLQRNLPQGSTQKQLQQIEWHLSQLLDTQIRPRLTPRRTVGGAGAGRHQSGAAVAARL